MRYAGFSSNQDHALEYLPGSLLFQGKRQTFQASPSMSEELACLDLPG